MPIFNDYSQEGKLLGTRVEIVNPRNIERYTSEFGKERTQGYLDATNDFSKAIELILFTPPEYGSKPLLPATVRKKLLDFLEERKALLNYNPPEPVSIPEAKFNQ